MCAEKGVCVWGGDGGGRGLEMGAGATGQEPE